MLPGGGDQLEGHMRMLLHKTVHRVHVKEMQPRLGSCPAADDVSACAKSGGNAEAVPRSIEHFQYLLPPLGARAVELHASGLEDVEVLAEVSFHENRLTRSQELQSAAGGNGFQDVRVQVGKKWDGLQEPSRRGRGVLHGSRRHYLRGISLCRMGSATTKQLPSPLPGAQRASPPCRRAICRTSASPSPAPAISLVPVRR